MATSTVPRAKAGILTLIAARAAISTVGQSWAHPGELIQDEAIFLGDTRFNSERTVSLKPAPNTQDEEYVIPVVVSVRQEGDAAQTCEERMWTIVGEVETAIRNDKSLNAASGVLWGQVVGKEPRNFIESQGRVSECVIDVAVRSRI